MKRRIRISPAMGVALLALFVALGGVSYAAVKINGKNIKNGTVTGKKLKNGTLKGNKIAANAIGGGAVNESSLGKVPSAANADSAGSAGSAGNAAQLGGQAASSYAKLGLEAVHVIGAPGEPAFQNTWGFFGNGGQTGFWKDQYGVVYFQGALDPNNNPPNDVVAFTLPAGYRPPQSVTFTGLEGQGPNAENEDCRVTVFPSGNVSVSYIGPPGSCHLNGLFFRTA